MPVPLGLQTAALLYAQLKKAARNPRYTFTRSQAIYGRPVETFEPYPQIYTRHIVLRYYSTNPCESLSIKN